jgi:hypothetical protein
LFLFFYKFQVDINDKLMKYKFRQNSRYGVSLTFLDLHHSSKIRQVIMKNLLLSSSIAVSVALSGASSASADVEDVLKGLLAIGLVAAIANQVDVPERDIAYRSRQTTAHLPAARSFAELSPAARLAIESRLSAWGYLDGGSDGHWDDRTWRAMRGFAFDAGMERNLHDRLGALYIFDEIVRY